MHPIVRTGQTATEHQDSVHNIYPLPTPREQPNVDEAWLELVDILTSTSSDYVKLTGDFFAVIEKYCLPLLGCTTQMLRSMWRNGEPLSPRMSREYYLMQKSAYVENPTAYKAQYMKPPFDSRGLGTAFRSYVKTLPYYCSPEEFLEKDGASITMGTNDGATSKLGCEAFGIKQGRKGYDALARGASGMIFPIEAKFLGNQGGSQNQQVADAFSVSMLRGDGYHGLALLDGFFVSGLGGYKKIDDIFT